MYIPIEGLQASRRSAKCLACCYKEKGPPEIVRTVKITANKTERAHQGEKSLKLTNIHLHKSTVYTLAANEIIAHTVNV